MTTSWMYDGFPLKRADENTAGDDFQYVIRSLDSALRHVFGFPTGVSLEPAFSIDADGNVEILQSLMIGSEVQIDEILDSIPSAAATDEDEQLATVNAIRGFIGDAVEQYLTDLDTFVLKAGDTMTGALVADGGITGTTALNISKAVFTDAPSLAAGIALQSGGKALIQSSSGTLVGDSSDPMRLVGSGTRPTFNGGNLALVSDLVDATGLVLAYVPKIGGTFTGTVEFANGLRTSSGVDYEMEYNSGANSFSAMAVGTDATGDVVLDSGAGIHRFTGDVRVDDAVQIKSGSTWYDVLAFASAQAQVGNASLATNILGSATRPLYNGASLALLADLSGAYSAGSGIDITGSTISIEINGINISHMPVGDYGEYLRISALGVMEWDSLDIAAGTGIDVSEAPVTKQVTISIDDGGVDTTQLAADAVTEAKIADDAIGVEHIDASGTLAAGTTYSLTVTDSALAWVEGSGGGGALLGSAELIQSSEGVTVNNYPWAGGYLTVDSASDGPYIIETFTYSAQSGAYNQVSVKLLIDGTTVASGTLDDVGDYITFPFYAKESWEIQAVVGPGGSLPSDGGTIEWQIQRLE